jgi:UDP-N-acetylmuramoylalanine--D-glutamate ligase
VSTSSQAPELRGKNVLVLGLGILNGGIGTALYCAEHGARLRITDIRPEAILRPALNALKQVEAEYILGRHREEDIHWADVVFRNPGVPPDHDLLRLAKSLGKYVEMEIAYFARHCPARMYFVTGTKGKTTTTTALHSFLCAEGKTVPVAGNMGEAAMPLLDSLGRADEVLVEVSSYQLEGLERRGAPIHVAVITNIGDDHLDRYGSVDRYRRVKLAVAEGQGPDDWLVIPGWDAVLAGACAEFAAKKVYVRRPGQPPVPEAEISPTAIVEVGVGTVVWRDASQETVIADLESLQLIGDHNRLNVALAAAAAFAGGRTPAAISSRVPLLRPVQHRLEVVGELGGVSFINDSAASAPVAAVAALEAMPGKRAVVLAGGQDKGADYSAMAAKIVAAGARVVLLPGSATEKLTKEFVAAGYREEQLHEHSMRDAVFTAWRVATGSYDADVILLSPGAASFGLFVNEFDRGDQFRTAFEELRAATTAIDD